MKKLPYLFLVLTLALLGCTADDATMTETPNQPQARGVCVVVAGINPSATSSGTTPLSPVIFSWNNVILHDITLTYNSYIEIAAADTPCTGTYPGPIPIDFFGTSSETLSPGVCAGCFKWRIVIEGYKGLRLECHAETDWQYFSY